MVESRKCRKKVMMISLKSPCSLFHLVTPKVCIFTCGETTNYVLCDSCTQNPVLVRECMLHIPQNEYLIIEAEAQDQK